MGNKKTAHHHGDLHATLVKAGVELIRELGPDALSIRKVAAKAGVSHAAPAHHFPTLAHLRTAIVAYGHEQFAQHMCDEMDAESEKNPRAMLLAAGRGYMKFVIGNAALYQLMFGGSQKLYEDEVLQISASKSRAVLEQITAPMVLGKAGSKGNQLLVWSIFHGFAGIVLNDNSAELDIESAPEYLESIFPDFPMNS